MEMFVYRCTSCQASLKYGKDKAGRKTKCPKCGTEVLLPADEDNKPTGVAGDEDEGGGYGVAFTDDDAETKLREEAHNKKAEKKVAARIKVRRKNIGELEAWARVHNGLLFLMIGACVWGAAYGLQVLVVFLGLIQGPEIGRNAQEHLFRPEQPIIPGVGPALNKPIFFLSLISGTDFVGTGQVLMIVAQVLMFITAALWMVGYGMCLAIENRMGSTGQLIGLFSLGGTNILIHLFFRFLPLVGAIGYVLVPFYAPELPLGEINTERAVPVHVSWCAAPIWEILLTLVVHLVLMLEPVMIAIFILTIAQMVRDQPLEGRAMGLIKMGFGILFLILAYHMYAVAGTSSVLIKLLRVIYLLWFGFQVGFIVKLATTCYAARELLKFYLNPDQ
jgi:DNA-directed RNA polymerase subunit RPC12/RpoP